MDQPALNDIALEIREHGSKKHGGKKSRLPGEARLYDVRLHNLQSRVHYPCIAYPTFPWGFSLHLLAFVALTLLVPCRGDEVFSLQRGGDMLPAVEMNAAVIHFRPGFHLRSAFNVSSAITQGNLSCFLCLCGTVQHPDRYWLPAGVRPWKWTRFPGN